MKNKLKRLIACLLALMLMSSDIAVLAEEVIKTLTLPAALQIIEEGAFYGNTSIDKVVVPDGTTEIRNKAFANSSLIELVLPDTLTFIADDAFDGCSEFEVSVPENCYAYDWAVRMGYINEENATPAECFTTEALSDGTLAIKSYIGSYTDVVIPSVIDGVQVTEIGNEAFKDCKELTSVLIPEGVVSIGDRVFKYCSILKNVDFPNTLRYVGEDVFGYCYELTSADFTDTKLTSLGDSLFTFCESLVDVKFPKTLEKIDMHAFHACDGLISLDLSETALISIETNAFWSCDGLHTVVLPATLKSIKSFGYCANLTNINLEETSLEIIGTNAFVGCEKLAEIVLPATVKRIEKTAFGNCSGLVTINLPAELEFIADDAFADCNTFTIVAEEGTYAYDWAVRMGYISEQTQGPKIVATGSCGATLTWTVYDDGKMTISGSGAMDNYTSASAPWNQHKAIIESLVIEEGVTSIGNYAFLRLTNLKTAEIHDDVTEIGTCAFGACEALQHVKLPNRIAQINNYTFDGCGGLTEIVIPDSVTYIGAGAFTGCSSLNGIILPDGVTGIGAYAFHNCKELTEITIPDNVTEIANDVFSGECGITTITFSGKNVSSIGKRAIPSTAVVICYKDSVVENWAITNGNTVEYIKEISATPSEYFVTGELDDGTLAITGYIGEDTDIIIPATINGVQVTEIAAYAFQSQSITSVVLPDTVTSIGEYAFAYCESLESIIIPEGVETIHDYTFNACSSLASVDLPNSVTSIGEYAFQRCVKLTDFNWPSSLETIGQYAFRKCDAFVNVVLPASVKHIELGAFEWCANLESIVLPETLERLDGYVFYDCSKLTKINLPESINAIGNYTFYRCTALTSFELPETVTSIGSGAFMSCSALTDIYLHHNISSIIHSAFSYCDNLTAKVDVGSYAYSWCKTYDVRFQLSTATSAEYFKTETLADGTLSITEYVGDEVDVVIPSMIDGVKVTEVGNKAFYEKQLESVVIPEGVTRIGQSAFQYIYELKEIQLPSTLKVVDDFAFFCCDLSELNLPEGLTTIGAYGFGLNRMITVEIPSSVTSIANKAFHQTENLTEYTVSEGNNAYKAIDGALFTIDGATLIAYPAGSEATEYTVPDGVREIADYAFNYASKLTGITLPDSLERIGYHAFEHCTSLQSIRLPSSCTMIDSGAFYNCSSMSKINIPYGVEEIKDSTFGLCSQLTSVELPDSVTEILCVAFGECHGLESIYIPESVTYIDTQAFNNCPLLQVSVVEGSYAHTWCERKGISFSLIGGASVLQAPILEISEKSYQSVTLTWEDVEGAEAYDIYCASAEAGAYAYVGTTEESQFIHNNLTCSTTYYYRVCAMSETLTSEYSNVIGVTTEDQIISLSVPENVVVTVISEEALRISWNAIEGAEGYYVMFDGSVIAEITGVNNCNFKQEELQADTEYRIGVKAYSHKNNGDEVVGAESTPIIGRTAAELSVEAVVVDRSLMLNEAITVNTEVAGNYGDFIYRYTIRKDGEIVAASGECDDAQYSYTPTTFGTYSVIVVVMDLLGRTSGCQIDGIMVKATDLEISNVAINKSIVMLGESVTITADSNRENGLTYSANVYCGDVKADSIIGVEKLTFAPDAVGVYSFAVEITDEYGETEYVYLKNILNVVPYWNLLSVTPDATQINVGTTVSFAVSTEGEVSDVTFSYTIYKDNAIYMESGDKEQSTYSISLSEVGAYKCVCVATDKYNHTMTATSNNVKVVRKNVVNDIFTTATHGNTLDLDLLDGMDSDEVRVAQGAVTVTWDKLSTDAYYRLSIECNTTNQEIVYNTKYTSNSYTIASSSIKAGYEYYVSVYRYNSSGTRTARLSFDFVVIGGSSLLLEADPKIVVPTKYASVNHDDLTIQWTKMNYASTIDIILEYNCGVDDHEILRETVSGATSTYTIPKEILQNGTEHYLRIVARDSLGNSKNASCYFYVGCSEDNLLEITEPVLNNSYMSDGYYRDKVPTYPAYEPILISWNFNPNVAFYSLHLEDYDNEKKETVYSNIRTNSYTVQPTVLVSGHRYSVEVYAHHTDTCYEVSEDMWFRAPYKGNLLLDPPKVISPELSLVEDDPTVFVLQDLTIAWEPVTAATTYDVEMRFQDEANSVDFEATGLKKPIVTIPKEDIWTDELNSIVITAYDASGNYTYEKYYIKAVDSTIVAPTLLSPALSADKTDIPAYAEKDMTLIWGAVEGAVEYRVQVRDYYAEEWDLIIDAQGVTDERYTIPADELYLGGRFRVRIKAIDQYGNGEYSDTYYFQIGSSKYMNLTVSDWTFDYEGGSKNTHLHTSQQWEADVSDSWISVSRSSGDASMQLTITVDENDDDFPRSGNVTFVNEAGGCVVFSVVQEGNGSANTGALKITNPDQGETLDYAGFRTNWSYNYDHAYFNVKLYDVTSRKTVYDEDQIITYYEDIPQSALTYGHIYQLTVEVYNAQYNKISESSIVFKVESLNGGSGDGTGTDDDVIDDTDAPEGVNEIIYAGITDGAEISLDDISVSWQNVIGADHYWVALRDMTLYPEGTAEADVIKIIDQETELLTVNILEGQLTEGHSYRLWIAAHKTGVDTPISGKNIYFTVKNSTDDGDTPEGTDTLIPTATLSAGTEQVVLGNQIALSGKVLANGGILNQIRVTVQDAQTGKFCDYAIYDLAAIEAFGYFDQFDLANVYPIVTGEGTHIGTSGSGYAREGSASLYLDTAGDKYQIVVYGKNNGDEEMHVLASTIVTLIGEDNEATGGSVTWNDHTYHLIDESMTWTEAKAYCESLGGYLVTITSAEEQQVIEGLLASSGTKNLYWIGLDENLESCWITGEVSDYTNWCAGEPNGSGEKYGEIYRDSAWSPAYTWNDSANAAGGSSYHALSNHGLICEFGDVVVAPKEYNFTLNSTAEELTVSVGDTITFAGEIRAGSAQLVNVQASLLDADDPTKGVRFDRFEDINADTFDLSDFKSIVAGETYSDESQSITVEAGKSYIVMLHVADANGVGFTDRDPNTEGPQGPSILVHVEEAEDSGLWNGHTYKVIDQSMTWTEAKAYCESLGGYLATITSAEEQQAVANVLSRYGSKNVYWIGLYEKGEDSVWVTGEEYSYSNWSSGEPNDNDEVELYAEMYRTSTWHGDAYEWNDSSNTANSQDFYSISNHGLICEFGGIANGPSAEGFELSAGSITEGDAFSISGTIKGNGSNVARVTISAFMHDDHTVGVHLQSLEGNGKNFDLSQFSPIRTDCAYSDNEGRIMALSGGNTYDIVIYATLANGEYFRNNTNPTQTIVVNKETVDAPDVLSVEFDSNSIAVNEEVGITVETDTDAEQLYMYAEDRSWGRCGSWATFDSDTTVDGNKRIWNVKYAFNTTGDRILTFYASKDGRNEGEGCDASIEVYEPVYTGISVEDFTLSQHFVQTGDTIELNGVVRGHGSNLSEVAIMLVENEAWDNAVYIASYTLNDESFDLGEETDPIIVGETYGEVSTYRLTSRSTASDSITMADGNDYQVVVRAVLENGEVLNDGYGYSRFLRVQNNPDDTEIALEKVEFTYIPEKVNLYEAREGIDVTWDDSQRAFYKLEYKLDTESEYRYIINNYGHQTLYFTNVGAAKAVQLRLSAVSGSEAGEVTTETISIQTLGELSFTGYTIGENDVFDVSRSSALTVPVVCENAVEYKIKGIFINEYPSGSDQSGKAVDTITSRIEGNVISIPRIEFMKKLAGLITTDAVKAPYFKLAVTPYDEEGNAGTTRWIGFKLVNGREPVARVSFNDNLPEIIESGKTVTISWTPTSDNVLYYNLYYRHSSWKESIPISVEAPMSSAEIEVTSANSGVVYLSLYAVLTNDNISHVDKTIAFARSQSTKNGIEELRLMLPDGEYWCHAPGKEYDVLEARKEKCECNYKHGRSRPGTASHPDLSGSCGCNAYSDALQCQAYARLICDQLFGSNPGKVENKTVTNSAWKTTVKYEDAKVGDFVFNFGIGHAYVVSAVEVKTDSDGKKTTIVKITDCNYQENCRIRWNETLSTNGNYKIFRYDNNNSEEEQAPSDHAIEFEDFTVGCSSTRAYMYAQAVAPESGTYTEFGLRLMDSQGNKIIEEVNTSSSASTSKEKTVWFDLLTNADVKLAPATQYICQLYTVYNGNKYWSAEKTFITLPLTTIDRSISTSAMVANLQNCTNNTILPSDKKEAMVTIAKYMLDKGFDPTFVAGIIGNIRHEASFGKFESSAYSTNKPEYLAYMDNLYNYREKYSGKLIYNGISLSELDALMDTLSADNYSKGKFGLGCVQWTGSRTSTLVDLYVKHAGASDTINNDQVILAEEEMIYGELTGQEGFYNKKTVVTNWKTQNTADLYASDAAYDAGYRVCVYYEAPASYRLKGIVRGETAYNLYLVMMGIE